MKFMKTTIIECNPSSNSFSESIKEKIMCISDNKISYHLLHSGMGRNDIEFNITPFFEFENGICYPLRNVAISNIPYGFFPPK